MTTRMTHPEHGAMHAYSASEIEALERAGWSVEGAAIRANVIGEGVLGGSRAQVAGPDSFRVETASVIPVRNKPGPKPKGK